VVAAAARRVEVLLHVDVHDYHAVVAMAKTILSRAPAAPYALGAVTASASGVRGTAPSRRRDARARANSSTCRRRPHPDGVAAGPPASTARARQATLADEGALLLGAARIRSAVRAAAAEIDVFAFLPVRAHARLAPPGGSRGRLLELASAAPPLSFAASASLRSSSARNFARSGRPKTSSSGRSPYGRKP